MKFSEFVAECVKVLEANPEAGNYDTVFAMDPEGNGFQEVDFTPTLGIRESEDYRFDFITLNNIHEWDYTENDINAVCIN